MRYDLSNRAFTLAETLITLGIIGVVAALTLPVVITKCEKMITVNRLKTTYSQLSQAIKFSEVQNGQIKNWNMVGVNAATIFENYMLPYLDITKTFNVGEYKRDHNYKIYRPNGTEEVHFAAIRDQAKGYVQKNGVTYRMPNGFAATDQSISLVIDLNGANKPNTLGKDVFLFAITDKYGLIPFGYAEYNDGSFGNEYIRENIINGYSGPQYACNKNERAAWCAALIMTDGWEIRNDYPW